MDSSTTRTDLVICKYISQAMEANGITQADLSKALEGRSKGYVSDRVLGKRSWAISELDRLAPLFGLPDALFTGRGSLWVNLQRGRPRLRGPRAPKDHR